MAYFHGYFKQKTCLILSVFLAIIAFSPSAQAFEEDSDFYEMFEQSRTVRIGKNRRVKITSRVPRFKRLGKGKNTMTAKVDLSEQKMKVYINNRFWQEWDVSSGGRGHRTPTGKYRPTRLHEMWYSRQYYNTPMPHSVFFHRGYAVHATDYVRNLGRAVSHGCVRLHPTHAKAFFKIVKDFGMHKTRIIIKN